MYPSHITIEINSSKLVQPKWTIKNFYKKFNIITLSGLDSNLGCQIN